MKKQKSIYKRLVGIILCLIILFTTSSNCLAYLIDNATVYKKGNVDLHLRSNFGNQSTYTLVTTSYTVYQNEGIEYPAYCINRELPGVEDVSSYTVNVEGVMTDPQVYRVITNGFPYKSPAELGVPNDYYAFQATKMAVYCVLYNLDPYTYFGATDDIGYRVYSAICNMVEIGRNGTNTYVYPVPQINKQGEIAEEIINGESYQVQHYTVSGNCEVTTYDVEAHNFPVGTKVFNMSNEEQYSYSGYSTFKVAIPTNLISGQSVGLIKTTNVKMKSYPILYGKTPNPAWQNYALAKDPYETRETETYLRVATTNVIINKTERGTSKGLEGAKYDIYQDLNKNAKIDAGESVIMQTGETDSSGNLLITDLAIGSYIAIETKAPIGYNLDDLPLPFNVTANGDTITVSATDTPLVKIIKTERGTDKKLAGAIYEVYEDNNKSGKVDSGDKLIYTTEATNSEGLTTITSLSKGTYVVKEKVAPKGYNLDDIEHSFELTGTNNPITISSDDTPLVKIIKTERGTDKKLAGAIYEVYEDNNKSGKVDSGDKLIYTTEATNNEGLTTITSLSKGTYVVKEKVAPKGYNLDDVEHCFELTATNEPVTVNSDDTMIACNVMISKVAIEDSNITGNKKGDGLKGTKFTISDINHNLIYDNLETDENGDIMVNLKYGTYYIEEVQAPEFYLLYPDRKDNIKIIEVKKQGETLSVKFENEPVKMNLDIEKGGIIQAQPNDEIKYTFPVLQNKSNVALDNFTWEDTLPTDYIRITKIFTGTYNEDLKYSVSVKTNKRDYFTIKEELSTQKNNYIDLSLLQLEEDEYITDYKFNFGTVKKDFAAEETPFIFTKVNSTVKPDDIWTNTTKLSGNYHGIYLEDNDDHTVKSYGKKLTIKKLPKTGF